MQCASERSGFRSAALAAAAITAAVTVTVQPLPSPDVAPRPLVVPGVELAALPTWLQWVDDGTTALTAQIAAIAGGLRNELDDPVPIVSAILRNQVFNVQDVGGALITSAQVLASALVGIPDLLLNAVFDAVSNPLSIPIILTSLAVDVVNTATAAVTPVVAALTALATDTFTRATGALSALAANAVPIGAALINVPVAVANAVGAAALGIAGSVFTLNPLNVVGAVGGGLVDVETASFNAVAGVATAVGNLRGALAAAVSYPLPPVAAAAPSRPAAGRGVPPGAAPPVRAQRTVKPAAAVSAPPPAAEAGRSAASATKTAKAAAARTAGTRG